MRKEKQGTINVEETVNTSDIPVSVDNKETDKSSEMLRKKTDVYSEKYDVHGVILDYGLFTKLVFSYKGKQVEIAIHLDRFQNEDAALKGQQIIESYIENLTQGSRKVMLHSWYIEDHESKRYGRYALAHGIVTGHNRLPDSILCHTSRIKETYVNPEENELIILTMNTEYHCPLDSCLWEEQDRYPEMMPDYKRIKELYQGKVTCPTIEQGKVLLVLANFCQYYFHSLYCVPADKKEPCEYGSHAHIGMIQDSFLISADAGHIDLRYFPHYQNIEFYSEDTNGMPLFIENIGDMVLYARTSAGMLKLNPGERKEVKKENAEADVPELPNGDLYPAGIVE